MYMEEGLVRQHEYRSGAFRKAQSMDGDNIPPLPIYVTRQIACVTLTSRVGSVPASHHLLVDTLSSNSTSSRHARTYLCV